MEQNFFLGALVEGSPPTLDGYGLYNKAIEYMGEQRQLLIEDDWEGLEALAYEGLGYVDTIYTQLYNKMGVTYQHQVAGNAALADVLQAHAEDEEEREAYFSGMITEVQTAIDEAENPEIIAILEERIEQLEGLKAGNIKGNGLLEHLRNTPYHLNPMDQTAIESAGALAVRSMAAICHSNFEYQTSVLEGQDLTALYKTSFEEQLANSIQAYRTALQEKIQAVYVAVFAKKDSKAAAEQLILFVKEEGPQLARTLATIRKFALLLKEGGKGTASEKIGHWSTLGGDAYRASLAALGAAYYLSLQLRAVEPAPKVAQLLKNTPFLAFDKPLPDGKNIEIAKVNQADEGALVETAGFVSNIVVGRDQDDKLITQLTLHDPSSDSEVTVAGVFVHFRHLGLLEDSYCRVTGLWKNASSINKGMPAIELDKLSVVSMSKESWKVAFLNLSDKFYARWPGNYHIQYGLAPHISAIPDGETESPILGAGELIFKPFIK